MTVDAAGIVLVPFNGGLIAVERPIRRSQRQLHLCLRLSWLRFDNTLGVNNEIDFTGFGTGVFVVKTAFS